MQPRPRPRLGEPQADGLNDALADGFTAPGLQPQLDELEAREGVLQRRMDEPFQPLPRLHPNLAALYRTKVAELHLALAGGWAPHLPDWFLLA